MKQDRIIVWLFAFMIFGVWIGLQFRAEDETAEGKLTQFFNYLEQEYVDTLDVDPLIEEAMAHILRQLDPHSTYIPLAGNEFMEERMNGGFYGIGVEFHFHWDTLVFTYVMPDGPAARFGIEAGDRVLAIDGYPVISDTVENDDVSSRIKGPLNSFVSLQLLRAKDTIVRKVQRGLIPLTSIPVAFVHQGVGYVKVARFSETTHQEFAAALARLDSEGMRTLVIDLRDNPGGFLHEATAIADEFLREDQVIVSTHYREGAEHYTYATASGNYQDLPVHILLNENSASAAEVLAGALQDHDRATIHGRPSFGKGLVQEDKYLDDGSRVRLTVAYYFTPSGRCIQREFEGQGYVDYSHDALFLSDSGKTLTSGGGIAPDFYLDKDSLLTAYWRVFNFGAINDFGFKSADRARQDFAALTLEEFSKSYVLSDMQLLRFLEDGGYGVALEDLTEVDRVELKRLLKASIAQYIWGYDGYQRVLVEDDSEVLEVLRRARTSLQ